MPRRLRLAHRTPIGALASAFLLLASAASFAAPLAAPPAGFVVDTIGGAFSEVVGVTNLPDGRLLAWERGGRVWMMGADGTRLPNPVLDIRGEVGAWRDFGLLGLAVDPNFPNSPHVYLLYVVDRHHLRFAGTPQYNPNVDEYFAASIGRVTRYTLDASTNFSTVIPTSRRILLGESMSTGIPILHQSHGIGTLAFGQDGTLLVSTGDSASYLEVDLGGQVWDGYVNQALADGIITQRENVGAFRSQLVDSFCGKILRIDPTTGDGVPSNPWFDASNPRAAKSRVFALGLRNPYRMTMVPGTGDHDPVVANPGTLIVGDVGWVSWEEVSVVTGPGQNLGWPVFEGLELSPEYSASALANPDATSTGCAPSPFRDLLRQDSQSPARFIRGCAVLQAENANASNAPVVTSAFGFTGSGFRDIRSGGPTWIEWTVNVPASGVFPIAFRYSNPDVAALPQDVLVDGVVVAAALPFPSTGAATDWRVATSPPVALAAGARKIRLRPSGQNGPNIDAMWVEGIALDGVGTPDVPASIATFTHHRPALDWRHPPAGSRTPGFGVAGNALAVAVGSAGGATGFQFAGYCALAGPILDFPSWPESWRGKLMFADFVSNWIQVADVSKKSECGNPSESCRCGIAITGISIFDTGVTDNVGVFADAVNECIYVARWNQISRYRYLPNGSQPPVVSLAATPTFGSSPLTVQFDASATFDPEGSPLTYSWDFGDGTSMDAGSVVSHVYTSKIAQGRTATVTARDAGGASASKSIRIGVNDAPPTARIVSINDGQLYPMSGSTTLVLRAEIADDHDGADGAACSWVTALHHDTHNHPEPPVQTCLAETVISPIGCVPNATFWYVITLTVTDSSGLVATDSVALYPDCDGVLMCPGDLNGDGDVGAVDLGIVLDAWGLGGSADLDRNGTVEARDVALLLDNWGVCAP
jgi:glucose/arabinose dehydrogenase/PKD repeat protein